MDWPGGVGDLLLGGLAKLANYAVPEHIRRQALERLGDFNPYKVIAGNEDLVRAVRLAWIEAALEVLKAAREYVSATGHEYAQREVLRFEEIARAALVKVRAAALDRRLSIVRNPIDIHVRAVIEGTPEFVPLGAHGSVDKPAPALRASNRGEKPLDQSLTSNFVATLAAVTEWPVAGVPHLFDQIAAAGLPTVDRGARRTFGELVFAAFAEMLKNPNKYPQAREAFHIALADGARALAKETLARIKGVDGKLDAAIANHDALKVFKTGAELLPALLEGQQRIVILMGLLPAMAASLEKLEDHTQAIRASVEVLTHDLALTAAQKEMLAVDLAKVKAELHGTNELVAGFLQTMVGRRVAPEQFATTLFKIGADWKAAGEKIDALTFPGQQTAHLIALRDRAREAHRTGRLDEAERIVGQIADQEIDALTKLEAQQHKVLAEIRTRRRGIAETKVAQASIATARLGYRDAAVRYAEAAALVEFDASLRLAYCAGQADQLHHCGVEFGDNAALAEAIQHYRHCLALALRAERSDDRAATQNNLGNALSSLGERERGTARLEEAVTAYRAALLECTQERVPLDWAAMQNNLGNVLRILGERENGIARLEDAETACRAALLEYTLERVPLDWAATQNNLGNVLSRMGERENGTAHLKEAVTAFRAALQEGTQDRVPLDWAATQTNLGNALFRIGERESGTARLEEAVTAYRAALLEYTQERVPLDWAATQNNLGNVLQSLGTRENGTARLEEAVTAYRAALQERTQERVPLDWALSHGAKGATMMLIAERTRGANMARSAVNHLEPALKTARDGGHAPLADYLESRLAEARELVELLQ